MKDTQHAGSALDSMKPPRVAHLTTVHHARDPRIFWKQAISLSRAGFKVKLVARHDRAETVEGVEIVPLPPVRGRYRRVLLQRPAYRIARALKADLYHIHDPELLPLAYALKKRSAGSKIVYDMHENNFVQRTPERYLVSRLEQWAFGWVDHVVLAEESYERVLPPRTPRTVLLNYFRPFEQRAPVSKTREGAPFELLYAGVLGQDRGLETMLDLAAQIREQELPWHLTMAGVSYLARERHAAEQRIVQEGLERVVARIGWDRYVPWPALEPAYAAAHVGLALMEDNPNTNASLPTKFYEYLFYGLPLICSDFPLWRRFVERHGCGAVVPPGDAAAAFRVLQQWYARPERYERLSAAAAAAAPRFLWKRMEKRLLALYERLLGARASGA